MNDLTLGDLVGTGNNPVVTAFLNRILGRKSKPEVILVEDEDEDFRWARPVVVADTGDVILAPKVA